MTEDQITCYYIGFTSSIQTTVMKDFGNVDVTVVNSNTGDIWFDTFDSGEESQTVLQISGNEGLYEITYTTESGDTYEGSFTIE